MKEVHLNAQKREELTKWLMELPAKYANPLLQFLQENEVTTQEEPTNPIGGGGGAGGPRPPKDE